MLQWFVAQSHPSREKFAMENIRDKGFRCEMPTRSEMLSPYMPSGQPRRRDRLFRQVPLFSGYVLVQFDNTDHRWRWINGTRGVIGVLPIRTDQPISISSDFVDELLGMSEAPITQEQLIELAYKYEPGDDVPVLYGAFRGHTGTYLGKRVRGLALFLALQTPIGAVEIPAQHAQPRGETAAGLR